MLADRLAETLVLSLRLQHLQWAAGIAVALCCLALGGMLFLASFDAYRRATVGVQEFERFRLVIEAMNAVSFERGPANILMAAPRGDAAALDTMRRARADTDVRLDRADNALKSHRSPDDDLIGGIEEIRARLAHGRGLIDAIAEVEPDLRSADSFIASMEGMFAAFDTAERVRDRQAQSFVRLTPEIATEVFLTLGASGLREHAGRLGSYVVMRLRTKPGDTPRSDAEINFTVGRLGVIQRALANLAASVEPNDLLAASIADLDRRFFALAMPRALAIAGAESGRRMPVADFTKLYSADLQPTHQLRDLVARVSQTKLMRMRDDAARRVATAGILTALVCLTMLLLALVFRRALFDPLMAAREQLSAMANGDLSDPSAIRRASPEIGEILSGLAALREEQRFRRELEEGQRRIARQLKLLADTDMLTGLLNRRAIEDATSRAFDDADANGHVVGVILFDIDHFKAVNDSLGHVVGDEVLRAIASELRPVLDPEHAFARFGGEEFLVLLPTCDRAKAKRVAKALHRRLADVALKDAPGLRITASFGVALREAGSGLSWSALLGIADRRLYAAKRAGRDQVFDRERETRTSNAA